MISTLYHTEGPLRAMLLLAAGVLAAAGPLAEGTELGTALTFSSVFPALVVLFAFLLPLDMLMCRIFRSEQEGRQLKRYADIMRYELITLAFMLAAWIPFWTRLLKA
ncbi:MAG: hypothetical protein ACREYE_21875 [Gammaproteobacteria bacterium]